MIDDYVPSPAEQEAQRLHDERREDDEHHDLSSCWCCCVDCDFDWDAVVNEGIVRSYTYEDGKTLMELMKENE
jgi:hypothetical protein